MLKLAITPRCKDNSYHVYQSYIDLFSPIFEIILLLPDKPLSDLSQYDALLITGGDDIDPFYYNQPSDIRTVIEDNKIEAFDFYLIHTFYKANKKIIGICRGIQLLNVYFKGTLIQHIDNHLSTTHNTRILPDTYLSKYYNNFIRTNSYHHQCIDQLAELFHANAISQEGIIEGFENHKVLAFQWHPEKMKEEHKLIMKTMIEDFMSDKYS